MVLGIAAPMTLAFLTTPLIGIVDTAVVGRLGDPALLAGLAAGAVVLDLCFASFNFLRSGTTGLVAQAFGRGRPAEEQAVLLRAFILAAICGLALILLAGLAARLGRAFIDPEPAVGEAMEAYVAIRFYGAPLTLANYAALGYFLGRGEAMFALVTQLFLNISHIALSVVLGLWLGWGLQGVAWGSVAGEAMGLALALLVIFHRFSRMPRLSVAHVLDRSAFRAMLALNRDIMIRTFALLMAFTLFVRQGAQFGTVTMAANAVLMNFFFVGGYFLDGIANAAEQIVGRSVGAGNATAFRRGVRLTVFWGFGLALVLSLLFAAIGPQAIAALTTSPEIRAEAGHYLPWAAVIAFSGLLAFQMDGVFIGATWSRTMRDRMILSLIVYLLAIFLLVPPFGNHGLWAALHIFLIARGLTLLAALPGKLREGFPALP
jgi:putative MATE family efflux protein